MMFTASFVLDAYSVLSARDVTLCSEWLCW